MSDNPILRAVTLIEEALRIASTAELHELVRLRDPRFGKPWEQLDATARDCCKAMREAAFMYGEPLPPPAPFCVVKTQEGNQVMRMVSRIGNVVKLEPLENANGKNHRYASYEGDAAIDGMDYDFFPVLYLVQELKAAQ